MGSAAIELVAGASGPEAAGMALVGREEDGAAEAADVDAGAACWLELELVAPPPPVRSSDWICACAGLAAKRAAAEKATTAAKLVLILMLCSGKGRGEEAGDTGKAGSKVIRRSQKGNQYFL